MHFDAHRVITVSGDGSQKQELNISAKNKSYMTKKKKKLDVMFTLKGLQSLMQLS